MELAMKEEKDEYNNFLIVDEYPNNTISNLSNGTESHGLSPNQIKRNLSPMEDRRERERDRDRDRDRDRRRTRSRSRSRSYDDKRRNGGRSRRDNSRSPLRNRGHSRDRYRRSDNHGRSNGSRVENKYRWEKTVYISNIPYEIRWTQLKDLFREKVGDIMFCEVFEKDGKSIGSAAMEFRTILDAERAVEIMHHYELDGRKISVRLDNEGYKTRQAKEATSSTNSRTESNKNLSANNGIFLNEANSQAAAIAALALNSLNSSSLLNNNSSQNSLLSNLGNLLQLNSPLTSNLVVTSSLMNGASPSVQQNSMLNMIASQLKVEGPVTNRLFVASLDYKVNEDKIKEVFGLAGVVQSVSLFKDKDGRSRGMAVVEYDSSLEALNAVAMFNHQQLMDRQMTVRFDTKPPKDDDNKSSTPSNQTKLPAGLKSIGSGLTNLLPKSTSNFSNNLNQIGGISNLSNMNQTNDLTTGLGLNLNGSGIGLLSSVGSSSLNTANSSNSSNILNTFSNNQSNGILGFPNAGANQISHRSSNGLSTNQISKVFVKNIPFSWDERRLKEKFRQAGLIEHVDIKMRDGKSRGCGLIRFSSPDQAVKAVELFNGSRFEGRTLEVKLDQMA